MGDSRCHRLPDIPGRSHRERFGRRATLAVDFSNLSSPSDAAVTVRVSTPVEEGRRRSGLHGIEPLTALPHRLRFHHRSETEQPGPLQRSRSKTRGVSGEERITLRVTVFSGDAAARGKSFVLPDRTLASGEGSISTTAS